jgi:sugar phosphate isomerase/epimerase
MEIGICATPADIDGIVDPPFTFIEAHVVNFLRPEAPGADFEPHRAATLACPLPTPAANVLFPPDLKVTGPSVDYARMERYAEKAFARAQAIRMHTIVFGSAGARMMPEGWSAARGFQQYVDAVKLIAPLAATHGVTIVVEALNRGECNLINTLDEGADAARQVNHPNVKLVADIFHMLRNGEAPDAISRHADLITHSHVAENEGRAEPGVHGDDFRPYLKALRAAKACSRLTIECVWSTGDMKTSVVGAVNALRRQLTDAGY